MRFERNPTPFSVPVTRARTPPPRASTISSGTITAVPPGLGASSFDSKRCTREIVDLALIRPPMCYVVEHGTGGRSGAQTERERRASPGGRRGGDRGHRSRQADRPADPDPPGGEHPGSARGRRAGDRAGRRPERPSAPRKGQTRAADAARGPPPEAGG